MIKPTKSSSTFNIHWVEYSLKEIREEFWINNTLVFTRFNQWKRWEELIEPVKPIKLRTNCFLINYKWKDFSLSEFSRITKVCQRTIKYKLKNWMTAEEITEEAKTKNN